MRKNEPEESPVIRFLQMVWDNTNQAMPHSWERLNHAMRQALQMAIGSGFKFDLDDFPKLSRFNWHRWVGSEDEWVYSLAVIVGNASAFTAWEKYKDRDPIIADNVRVGDWTHAGYLHLSGDRKRERLFVGCGLKWKGEDVKVTSFTDKSAVAVAYHPSADESRKIKKIKKRFIITRDEIIAERKARKAKA